MSKKRGIPDFYEKYKSILFNMIKMLEKGIENSTELKEMFKNFLKYILKQLDLSLSNYKQLCSYISKSPLNYDKLRFYYFVCFMHELYFSKFVVYNFLNNIKEFDGKLKNINNIDDSGEGSVYLVDPVFYTKLCLNPKFYTKLYEHIKNSKEEYFTNNLFCEENIRKLDLLSIFDLKYSISYVRKYYKDKDMDNTINVILEDLSKFDNLLSFLLYFYGCHVFSDMFDNFNNMKKMFKNISSKEDLLKAEVIYTLVDILSKIYSSDSKKDTFIKLLNDFSNMCLSYYLVNDCISGNMIMDRNLVFFNAFLMYALTIVYSYHGTIDNNYSKKFFIMCGNYLHNFEFYGEPFYNSCSVLMPSNSNNDSMILDSFIQKVNQLNIDKNLDAILFDNIELCKSFYNYIILDVITDYIGLNGKQMFEKDIQNMQNSLTKIIKYKNVPISVIEYLKSFNIKHTKNIVSEYFVLGKKYDMHLYGDVLHDFLSNIYVINLLDGQQYRNKRIKNEGILSHIICRRSKNIDELNFLTLEFIKNRSLEGKEDSISHSDEMLYSAMINYLLFYTLLPIFNKYNINTVFENVFDAIYMCMRESTYTQRKTFNRISNLYVDEYHIDYDLVRIIYYIIYLIENGSIDVFTKKNKYSLFRNFFKNVINNCGFDNINVDIVKNIFVNNYKNIKYNLSLFDEFISLT